MSLAKQEVATSDFIKTGSKAQKPDTAKKLAIKIANQLSTGSLLWLLVKRHKTGLLTLWAILMTLTWAFPAWPQMLQSIFN